MDYKVCWDYQETLFNETIAQKIANRDLAPESQVETKNHLSPSIMWQAAYCPSPIWRSNGSFSRQIDSASGQRVWNLHPEGIPAGLGTIPEIS